MRYEKNWLQNLHVMCPTLGLLPCKTTGWMNTTDYMIIVSLYFSYGSKKRSICVWLYWSAIVCWADLVTLKFQGRQITGWHSLLSYWVCLHTSLHLLLNSLCVCMCSCFLGGGGVGGGGCTFVVEQCVCFCVLVSIVPRVPKYSLHD